MSDSGKKRKLSMETPGKTNIKKSKKAYEQKYRKEWELVKEFKGWLGESVKCPGRALCKVCGTDLQPHKKSIREHLLTKKHLRNADAKYALNSTPKITTFAKKTITDQRKMNELKIAAYIAEHCSMNSVDHLSQIIKSLDEKSGVIQDIKLHRTKCTALIINVLAPCMLQELIDDIGDTHYSMIIDESTCIDTKKALCIMVRYFSKKLQKIRTTFYRLVELEVADAESLYQAFIVLLKSDNLIIENLIGIGVDGANVMVGQHNSFVSKLASVVPHLVKVKCVCHSLHLAAEYAFRVLPRHIEFLIRETHNWFSISTKRQIEYRKIFQLINDSNQPNKIPKLSGTRWLARTKAISTILDQWDSLKLHFQFAREKERCYAADQLYAMFSDIHNKLYLLFLDTTLKKVTSLNKLFQAESIDCLKLFEDLNELLYSLLQRIVTPQQLEKVNKKNVSTFDFQKYLMPLHCVNFGYAFTCESDKCPGEILTNIKKNCLSFVVELCKQLQIRMPENINILEKMSIFSPTSWNNFEKQDIKDLVVRFQSVHGDVDATIEEWNILHKPSSERHESTEVFWANANKVVDASGSKRFGHISKLVLSLLALPISNATVERAFSIMNIVKDKLRNKMAISTAEAILRIRLWLVNGCIEFTPGKDMLDKFNSEEMYNAQIDEVVLESINNICN